MKSARTILVVLAAFAVGAGPALAIGNASITVETTPQLAR